MSDTSPHTFFYESTRADQASELPREGMAIICRRLDGSDESAIIVSLADYQKLRERIRHLEIERNDYKAYTVATMNGWRFWQETDGLWFRRLTGSKTTHGPHATWYLAARAAAKDCRNAAAGKAAEYIERMGK